MLLRLSVENHLSILDRQELSLIASNLRGSDATLLLKTQSGFSVLPSAVIYGANASGKSNLLDSLEFIRHSVMNSHTPDDDDETIYRRPFTLIHDNADRPSKYEIDFMAGEIRYQFGFSISDSEVIEEWVYTFPEGRPRRLYERSKQDVVFGSFLKGQKKPLLDLMRKDALFISIAGQRAKGELARVASYLRRISCHSSVFVSEYTVNSVFLKRDVDLRTMKFLKALSTGVRGSKKGEAEEGDVSEALKKDLSEVFERHMPGFKSLEREGKPVEISLEHDGFNGSGFYLPLSSESSGTRRLLVLLNEAFSALDAGTLLVVDELDAGLHTRAAEALLGLFADPHLNTKGAQLLTTTHDTNLLNSSYLRRDQVWFCEKTDEGTTSLFSLAEVKSRASDNFELGYLQGRYGAIPEKMNKVREGERTVTL